MWKQRSRLLAVMILIACERESTAEIAGQWKQEENGESVELVLEHDKASGRVRGTFSALGKQAPISGRADGSSIVIEKVGDVSSSPENGTMVGAVVGEQMMLTIAQPGQDVVVLSLTRQPGSNAVAARETRGTKPSAAERMTEPVEESYTASGPEGFIGSWEMVSDDGTNTEKAELELNDGVVTGVLQSLERGYYSGRVTITAEVAVRGRPNRGGLDLEAWNTETGSAQNAVLGRAVRRGPFLVMRIGDGETGYARPGVSVVQSAQGSAAGEKLARTIAGRIYSAAGQASGRGAFVGRRTRIAFCSDGSMSLDVSDLASSGGDNSVSFGDATSRRGEWGVVLLAGAPVVRAKWNGTGSSYSLTRYFRVQPVADGSAIIDGTRLPVTGSC